MVRSIWPKERPITWCRISTMMSGRDTLRFFKPCGLPFFMYLWYLWAHSWLSLVLGFIIGLINTTCWEGQVSTRMFLGNSQSLFWNFWILSSFLNHLDKSFSITSSEIKSESPHLSPCSLASFTLFYPSMRYWIISIKRISICRKRVTVI